MAFTACYSYLIDRNVSHSTGTRGYRSGLDTGWVPETFFSLGVHVSVPYRPNHSQLDRLFVQTYSLMTA